MPPPFILTVETSSRIGSVAIALGENLLAETKFAGPTRHSVELFPAVCALLDRFGKRPDQIDHIYISVGPGSFTGLRIAVTMAKTMSLANAAKIVAVDSLDVAASNVIYLTSTSHERVAVIIDAKRGQFFIAVYEKRPKEHKCRSAQDDNRQSSIVNRQYDSTSHNSRTTNHAIWHKIVPDCLTTAEDFLTRFAFADRPIWLLGDGLLYYKDKFKADGVQFMNEQYWSPRASNVHLLGWQKALTGQFANPLTLQPNYLRAPEVTPKENDPSTIEV